MEEARAEMAAGLAVAGLDFESLDDATKAFIEDRFILGDPDTVGERLQADLALGVDGFTINLPANGHIEGRVALLGETVSKVLA